VDSPESTPSEIIDEESTTEALIALGQAETVTEEDLTSTDQADSALNPSDSIIDEGTLRELQEISNVKISSSDISTDITLNPKEETSDSIAREALDESPKDPINTNFSVLENELKFDSTNSLNLEVTTNAIQEPLTEKFSPIAITGSVVITDRDANKQNAELMENKEEKVKTDDESNQPKKSEPTEIEAGNENTEGDTKNESIENTLYVSSLDDLPDIDTLEFTVLEPESNDEIASESSVPIVYVTPDESNSDNLVVSEIENAPIAINNERSNLFDLVSSSERFRDNFAKTFDKLHPSVASKGLAKELSVSTHPVHQIVTNAHMKSEENILNVQNEPDYQNNQALFQNLPNNEHFEDRFGTTNSNFKNQDQPGGYQFGYLVDDDSSGTLYSRYEKSDGDLTLGQYKIRLPNGRTQVHF